MTKAPRKKSRPRAARPSVPWLNLAPTGSNLNVEDFLTFRITRLSNALRTHLTKRYLEEFGLSLPEWRLLALIARFAPMRFSEVTSRSSMDFESVLVPADMKLEIGSTITTWGPNDSTI